MQNIEGQAQNNFCATQFMSAPQVELKELKNLFFELSHKACNLKCKHCYIEKNPYKQEKDFIPLDKIKSALLQTKGENLNSIYLTGGEPLLHPDFNTILRLCLKRCNVCICTNSSFLNEKKIRFLKKVEDEGLTQIFFKLSLAHYDELESDKAKYRGNYRQTIYSMKILSRYGFTTVLTIQNYYNLAPSLINEMFNKIFKEQDITNVDVQITASYPSSEAEISVCQAARTDCMHGRVLSENGIYSCPFLSNDYRGRVGSSFKDFSKNVTAETDFCGICSKNNNYIFTIG